MKKKTILAVCAGLVLALANLSFGLIAPSRGMACGKAYAVEPKRSAAEPWKPSQLLAPADLAKTILDEKAKQPVIICVGPGAVIKGSIDVGPARDSNNVKKLRLQLEKLPRDTEVVIYCGCCPFAPCPNIRPAFTLLNEMKFTRPQLLNLEHNIKVDWIDKGYPVN